MTFRDAYIIFLQILFILIFFCPNNSPQKAPEDCDSCAILKGKITDTFSGEPVINTRILYEAPGDTIKNKKFLFSEIFKDSSGIVHKYFSPVTHLLTFGDSSGLYEVRMFPGRYAVIAFGIRHPHKKIDIELKAGEIKILNIDLPGKQYMDFLNDITGSSEEEMIIEWGRNYLVSLAAIKYRRYWESPELIKKDIIFNERIVSPLKNTNFYSYNHNLPQIMTLPSPGRFPYRSILWRGDDTMFFVPPSSPDKFIITRFDSSTIEFLNERLQKEEDFDSEQVKELSALYNYFMNRGGKILNSWEDIEYNENDVVTRELKNTIQPPEFRSIDSASHLVYYTWNKRSLELLEINFYYSNKKINAVHKLIGIYGTAYGFL